MELRVPGSPAGSGAATSSMMMSNCITSCCMSGKLEHKLLHRVQLYTRLTVVRQAFKATVTLQEWLCPARGRHCQRASGAKQQRSSAAVNCAKRCVAVLVGYMLPCSCVLLIVQLDVHLLHKLRLWICVWHKVLSTSHIAPDLTEQPSCTISHLLPEHTPETGRERSIH